MAFDTRIKAGGVSLVKMSILGARSFCPLGQAPYTHMFNVIFEPNGFVPDYLEVQEWVNETFGERVSDTIEDATNKFADYLYNTFVPISVIVEDTVIDAKHFPVVVKSERRKERCN